MAVEALARTPNDPVVLILAARTYATGGDIAKYEQTLLKTIEVAPDTLEAYQMLGELYTSQKRLDQALQMFTGLAARQSKPVGAKTMIGMLLQQQGKREEAKAHAAMVTRTRSRRPLEPSSSPFGSLPAPHFGPLLTSRRHHFDLFRYQGQFGDRLSLSVDELHLVRA